MFKLNSYKETERGSQEIDVLEFTFSSENLSHENPSEENVVDHLIHSKSFIDTRSGEQAEIQTGDILFLNHVFEIDLLKVSDFKQTDKNGVIKFLDDYDFYTGEEGLKDTEELRDFIDLKNGFNEVLNSVQSSNFFIISKEWFDEEDQRLQQDESWVYPYY